MGCKSCIIDKQIFIMLTIPENTKVLEWPGSTIWFDNEGVLYSISKKAPSRTLEETEKYLLEIKKLIRDKKVCMLVDVTHSSETSSEVRDYVAEEFPKFIKAIAMVSDSALGTYVG